MLSNLQKYSWLKCLIVTVPIAIVMAGTEVGGIFGLRVLEDTHPFVNVL
jgi:hypothetical protein